MQTEKIIESNFNGIDYFIKIKLFDDSLYLELEDLISGDVWNNLFTSDYIEQITQKTGNYKKFAVFIKMMFSYFDKTSDSVTVDILTLSDLQQLKQRKSSTHSSTSPFVSNQQKNKIYFIISYNVEFDKVHYPLPLNYEHDPSSDCLKQTIRKLRTEMKELKEENQKLKEYEPYKENYLQLHKQNEELQQNLQQSLNLSEQMKTQIEQLTKEIETLSISEKKLKLRLDQLENELKASLNQKKKQVDKSYSQASLSQLNMKGAYETERQSIARSKDISIDNKFMSVQKNQKRVLKSNASKSGKNSNIYSDIQSDICEQPQKNKENGINSSAQKSFLKKGNLQECSVSSSVKNLDQKFNKLGQLLKQAKYF